MLLYVPSFINWEQSLIFFKLLTLSLLIVVKEKFTEKTFLCVKIITNENFYVNFLPKRFHFNSNTLGFRPQMKKLSKVIQKYYSSKLHGRIFFTDPR